MNLGWTEEEYERHERALDGILLRHLGPPPNTSEALVAEYVLMATWLPASGTNAMNHSREREKLAKARRLAGELSQIWQSLHDRTRSAMELRSTMIHEAAGRGAWLRSKAALSLDIISVLDAVIEAVAPFAEEAINNAPPAGRRDLLNVALVERLRNVWQERKGTLAPNSMSEAGAFADFMIDAFEALGLTANPRAAVDSWREFRANDPPAQ